MIAAVDTNVLISGLLFGGVPETIIDAATEGVFSLALSPELLEELEEVLRRPKLGQNPDVVRMLVRDIESAASIVYPRKKRDIVADDPDDNAVIDCAVEAHADYIVSGDTHLIKLGIAEGIRILSPADFVATAIGKERSG